MSSSSPYAETCALAAPVRVKFNGQYGNKDQKLRLVVAHATLYDRLDHHIEQLRKGRGFNVSREELHIKSVAVPNHQVPFRTNQHANHVRSGPRDECTPRKPLTSAAECSAKEDEDPKPPLGPSDRTCSVQAHESDEGLCLSDIVAQASLQHRRVLSFGRPKAEIALPESKARARAAALSKTLPLAPL
ncbi:MAG: hypothetical protein Q9226_009302, partial [Calogaya cf. arnoldii]